MESFLTTSNVTFALGFLGVIFGVYQYFKEPQIDSDKAAALLAQQVNSQNEAVAQRFKDIQDSFNGLLLQSNNHVHTLDTKVDGLTNTVSQMRSDIVRLGTIIEERIPKK